MMQELWMTAGGISGWILIELFGVAFKTRMPLLFNLGAAFVGGLIGYTVFN